MIQDIENIWDETDLEGKTLNINKWKNGLIEEMLTGKTNFGKIERDTLHTIIELEKFMNNNKDICILQADKGKKTIMMETEEFNKMARMFMEKGLNKKLYNFEDEINKKMKQIITNKEVAKFKLNITKWKMAGIFNERNEKNKGKERFFWDNILNIKEKIPKMSFIIKAHKEEGLQIRNICPKNGTWTHQLSTVIATILDDTLKGNLEKINHRNCNISDIQKFAKQIQGTTINENEEINIIDIKEMFNEINIEQLMNIINRFIDRKTYNSKTIMEMVKYDLTEANWITYENRLYKQNQGIPMGAPTSTTYANIFLDYFITINFEEMTRTGLRSIFKYVDDILIINEKDKAKDIIQILEKDTKLKFNIEEEKNKNEHTFLDMKILIEEDRMIKTSWNKKIYVSNRIINAASTQNWITKLATIKNRIQRTMELTNEKYLYEALQINIEEIINNGYNLTTIATILKKIKNANQKKMEESQEDANTIEEMKKKIKIIEDSIETINIQKQINIREKNKNKNMNNDKTRKRTILGSTPQIRKKNRMRNINKRNQNSNKSPGNNARFIRTPFRNEQDLLNTKKTIGNIFKQKQKLAVKKNKSKEIKSLIRENFKDAAKGQGSRTQEPPNSN